jgi:hypothetical protein
MALALLLPLAWMLPDASGADMPPPFAGFLGGSGDDRAHAVAADASGAIFVAGVTSSADMPVSAALQGSLAGDSDAFVAKFAADGKTVLFATYLGGSGDEEAFALVPDGAGGVWLAGGTTSTDFPMPEGVQASARGGEDGFVAHISSDGSTLLAASYLGGSGNDRAKAVALDASGAPWVAGLTDSDDMPLTDYAFQTYRRGEKDAFAARVASDGRSLLVSTYLGGYLDDEACALLVDPTGAVVVSGRTSSSDFPLSNAVQWSHGGGMDGFVARLSSDGMTLPFATFLGGSGDDEACSLSPGASGFACAGTSGSTDFPFQGGPPSGPAGGADAFVALFSDQDGLQYAGRVGGSGDDRALAVALEPGGAVVLAGSTSSADLPLRAAAVTALVGATDGFVVRIAKGGNSTPYATYLGGSAEDEVEAMALSGSGAVLIAGRTESSDFGTGGTVTGATSGGSDGFLARVPTAPLAPSGLVATAPSHREVLLSWTDASGGRALFEVERRVGSGGYSPSVLLPEGTTAWTDGTVLPASIYGYRVRAFVDGSPSPYSAEFNVVTPSIPIPAVPGSPAAVALSPREIRVTWLDLSEDEVSFEVFRSEDGGPFALVRGLSANTTQYLDAVVPDRAWTYRVRSVGVTGPSGLSEAVSATTDPTLAVEPVQGKRKDGAKAGKDSLLLLARVAGLDGSTLPDPRISGLSVGVGPSNGPAVFGVPAGAEGWKARRGVLSWRSPKGYPVKGSVVVDPARGTIRVKASRLDLVPCPAGSVEAWVRWGTEAGSTLDTWLEPKPGMLTIQE